MLNHALVQLEATGLQTLSRAGVTAVEDGHVIFLRHLVDGIKETHEVLLRIDVLLAMR